MLATNLLGCTVCFRLRPVSRHSETPHQHHKTKGIIRAVYLDPSGSLRFCVEDAGHDLQTVDQDEIVICHEITFDEAVRKLEKEDAEQ